MKLLIILCEGQTEQEFCNDVLSSHFLQYDILLQAPTIKKSRGGTSRMGGIEKANHRAFWRKWSCDYLY